MELSKLCDMLKDRGGVLVSIAGRPRTGKSSYIKNLIAEMGKTDEEIFLYFSLANESGFIEHRFADVFDGTCQSKIIIDDTPGIEIDAIIERCKKENPDIIVIDYFELVSDKDCRENRIGELDSIANKLKRLARELEIPILLEVQMSAYREEGHEKLSIRDLRDVGKIGEISDITIFVGSDTRIP